jgi:23S rRNA (uracil1939-C5)-methyltransferase
MPRVGCDEEKTNLLWVGKRFCPKKWEKVPMTKSDLKIGSTIPVRFEAMALGGKGKGTPEGMEPGSAAVFSELVAPGDLAEVRVLNIVKRYVEAELVRVIEPSEHRVTPPCEYFGLCGGCNWQHLSYDRQLYEKADVVSYVLARNGLGREFNILCKGSDYPLHYRSRADMTFVRQGNRVGGGFLKRGTHDPLDIARCPILVDGLDQSLANFKHALNLLVQDVPEDWPFRMRVMQEANTGRLYGQPRLKGALAHGLLGPYELVDDRMVEAKDALLEFHIDGCRIQYDPFCFTQVNLFSNPELVGAAIDALDAKKSDRVLELYAGIGNFTMPIAKRVGSILAVEAAAPSSRFSKINAKGNDLKNVEHLCADSAQACRKLVKRGEQFEKVVIDPPREGMGAAAVNALCDLDPNRIVSISCHPDSLAKDLKTFVFRGYRIESIEAHDMFGQTFHVETVTVLQKQ